MTTNVIPKIANPLSPASGASGTTGTGNLVFSESPTINNPNLTGNVSANVNLRYGSISTLLGLPGGTSEIGYASDVDTLVKFNGTAGQAEVYGKYTNGTTLNFYINDASYAANTAANPIDCRYISNLIISFDLAMTSIVNRLYIKLPLSTSIPSLVINFNYTYTLTAISQSSGQFLITVSYQPEDIASNNNAYTPAPNDPPALLNTAGYNFDGGNGGNQWPYAFSTTFCLNVTQGTGWTRLPIPGESFTKSSLIRGYIGEVISNYTTTTTLTSGTITNIGSLSLPAGVWMLYGQVAWVMTTGTIASELSVSTLNTAATTLSSVSDGGSTISSMDGIVTALRPAIGNTIIPTGTIFYSNIAGVAISSTTGGFTCTSNANIVINQRISISGTLTGSGSITGYTNPTTYVVVSVTGSPGAITGFILRDTAGNAITTGIGTTTGLTFKLEQLTRYINARFTAGSGNIGTVTASSNIKAVRIA